MPIISRQSSFSETNLVDWSASTREWLFITQTIGAAFSKSHLVNSKSGVGRKGALSIPSDIASVSPLSVLHTNPLIPQAAGIPYIEI